MPPHGVSIHPFPFQHKQNGVGSESSVLCKDAVL